MSKTKLMCSSRFLVATLCCVAGIILFGNARAVAQSNSSTETTLYTASAYGAGASVGSNTVVARVAQVSIGSGCGTAQVNANRSATVASVIAPPLVLAGVVTTDASSSTNKSTGKADTLQFNLLAGLISGNEVVAVSTTTEDSGETFHVSAAGSHFVNLVVLGNHIASTPAPNTTIQLAGLGRVVLNEQLASSGATGARLTVNMIHVYITVANLLGIKAGTQIVVASASSGITEISGPAALDGVAYGASVNAGLIRLGEIAEVGVPCAGTEDVVHTATVANINLPTILASLTITDTAQGDADPGNSYSKTSSRIEAANVLAGLIKASLIQDAANASTTDGTNFHFTSSGSFVNLKVAGHPEIHDSVGPNTSVSIAGIGTLYLHRVIQTKNSIEVRMIELVINHANVAGLPLGADIRVAVSEASLHSLAHP